MVRHPNGFGEELRRRRLASNLTLVDLAGLVHYSKAQLSKVERGLKAPSRELVRLCDAALDARGALIALTMETPSKTRTPAVTDTDEVWIMRLSTNDPSLFAPLSRRQAMGVGAVSLAGMHIGKPTPLPGAEEANLLSVSRSLFDHYRRLGQSVEPNLLLPALIAQTHTLRELSTHAETRGRRAYLRLGSRYAEYVGWLVQETGDDEGALWWTRRAVKLAVAGDDHDLAAYGLVRHALITLYQDDAPQTVELAQHAQRSTKSFRIRGLAAQREAQGHALAGDYDACMWSLERARTLLARAEPDPDVPVIGTTNLADPAEMVRGWCLYDLGRPDAAADVIAGQLARVPEHAARTRVRYGIRHALAHAVSGEVEHACELAKVLLDPACRVGTATIAADLRSLARTLARHPKNPSVRELAPELGTALQIVTPRRPS
ncbi:helix-turn-helix transcriptional regulator [Actinocorallia lasiicapitis]